MLNPEKPGIAKTRAYSGAIGHDSLYTKTTITISSRHDICKAFLIISSYSIILSSCFCEYFMNPFSYKTHFLHWRIIAFLSWSLLCNTALFLPDSPYGRTGISSGSSASISFSNNKKRHPFRWSKVQARMRDSTANLPLANCNVSIPSSRNRASLHRSLAFRWVRIPFQGQ